MFVSVDPPVLDPLDAQAALPIKNEAKRMVVVKRKVMLLGKRKRRGRRSSCLRIHELLCPGQSFAAPLQIHASTSASWLGARPPDFGIGDPQIPGVPRSLSTR